MRRKKEQSEQAPSSGDGHLTPAEIQQVEFRLAFRGYNERDVDAFLDRITEDLSTYLEEIHRLRSGAGASTSEGVASGKGSEASAREAEEIVARAKQRAALILGDAEAAVGGPAAAAGAIDPRGAIAPFLTRERDFLQSLGGLVQGHAEEIKALVLSLRAKAETETPSAATGPASDAADAPGAAQPDHDHDRAEADLSKASPVAIPEAVAEHVVISDGAESVRTGDPESVPAERPSGERSLRDLFWGED
jgi:DivIVA domain-containing protein